MNRSCIQSCHLVLAGCLLLACVPDSSHAYFERFFVSSRALSLGGAFVAVADDASATVLNPAGLTQMTTYGFYTSYLRPYDVSDLDEHFVSAAVPVKFGVLGVSWHRFALRDVSSEDLFTLAFGADYIRTSQDASLSFGGSLDLARVSYRDKFDRSQTVVSGSASVLLRPFPIISIAYLVRNIGQSSFDLVDGGGETDLKTTHVVGLSYYIERRVALVYDRRRGQDGHWRDHFGVEVEGGDNIEFRAGLRDHDVTGGVGIHISRFGFDVGVASHEALGLSYVLSVGFSPGEGGE